MERIHSWFPLLYTDDEPDLAEIYFNAIILLMKKEVRLERLDLFKVSRPRRREISEGWERMSGTLRSLARRDHASNSWIASVLGRLSTEELLTVMALTRRETSVRYLSLYLSRLRLIRRELDGKALLRMGYETWPLYRDILQAVQDARVDGVVNSLEEEKMWVRDNFPL